MNFYLGNTDYNWYYYLSQINPEDVNFWQPGGKQKFKALSVGAPFLFKLKRPYNVIGGVGFFSSHTFLPLTMAWDTFKNRNGCDSLEELRKTISSYRKEFWDFNPQVGCIVLTNPIFFSKEDWIPVPPNWANSIVQGKLYSTGDEIGLNLWKNIEILLDKYLTLNSNYQSQSQLMLDSKAAPQYTNNVLSKVRIGQGAFRVLITDAYTRRCSISGEKTLPVLEAAHIKSYSESGPHLISNGILLRSDIHKLFDSGYLTVTDTYKIEVSKRIKEEYENGKEYYQYHGKDLIILPQRSVDLPNKNFIEWHNTNVFKA